MRRLTHALRCSHHAQKASRNILQVLRSNFVEDFPVKLVRALSAPSECLEREDYLGLVPLGGKFIFFL